MNPDPDEHTYPGEEDLEWGHGVREEHRVDKPQSKYWAVGEQARKMIPHESLCKVFCSGKNCKYCTPDGWRKEQMAVDGLYSEWVTCNILATARMSNENIKNFNMTKQLQDLQVKTVINLQQPGEHAHCGFGNDEASGFSYNPQTLMDAGLYFYNFAIHDYGVTCMPTLLDIVKVMQFAVSLGKVAVHCHAGLGRTGLVIACYLIYNNRVKTSKAIQYVRSRRAGAIQTKQQMKACQQFEEYLEPFFVIFSKTLSFSFSQFLTRQRHLLHGYEARKLKHIPKVLYVCCERLLELCGNGNALTSLRNTPETFDLESLSGSLTLRELSINDQLSLNELSSKQRSPSPNRSLKNSANDKFDGQRNLSPNRLSNNSAYDKYAGQRSPSPNRLPNNSATDKNQKSLESALTMQFKGLNVPEKEIKSAFSHDKDLSMDTARSSDVVNDSDDDDDDCIVYGLTKADYVKQAQKHSEEMKKEGEGVKQASISLNDRTIAVLTSEQVWNMIIRTEYSSNVLKRINEVKDSLNKTEKAWHELAREEDPIVISGIICEWLDQLTEPVLRAQDVSALVENITNPRRALLRLEKSTKHFLEYIILIISNFEIMPETLRQAVLEFFLSYLCQKRLNLGYFSPQKGHFCDLKQEHAIQLFKLFFVLLEEGRKE